MPKTRFGLPLVFVVSLVFALLAPRRVEAFINVGAEGGLVKRSADSPNNLKLGLGYGLHGEIDMIPLLKVGPYYLHSELSSADSPAPGATDAAFNTLGLRARFLLPIPGSYKPYAYAGLGYTWVNYTPVVPSPFSAQSGHFFETPLGVGIAYEVIAFLQLSLDAAYRPGFSFGGDAFDAVHLTQPTSGWSLMLGAALDL
jgi:opacity protein-like surface antigen